MSLIIPEAPQPSKDSADKRMYSPAAARNLVPIISLLERIAPTHGRALEIASGTGEHVVAFAKHFPNLRWHPTDIAEERIDSIKAWTASCACQNIAAPAIMDIAANEKARWHQQFDLVFCANLLHLINPAASQIALRNIANTSVSGGTIVVYGPFTRDGSYASDRDKAFDQALRKQDPAIGLKECNDVVHFLEGATGRPAHVTKLPANNLAIYVSGFK